MFRSFIVYHNYDSSCKLSHNKSDTYNIHPVILLGFRLLSDLTNFSFFRCPTVNPSLLLSLKTTLVSSSVRSSLVHFDIPGLFPKITINFKRVFGNPKGSSLHCTSLNVKSFLMIRWYTFYVTSLFSSFILVNPSRTFKSVLY